MSRRAAHAGLIEFLAVARHGSFRAASAELRVSPAAVSQAVKTLEAAIGLPLLLRTTRSVSLTEAGARLLGRARPAFAEIDDALDELRDLRGQPAGRLRLSVPRIALDLVVLPLLPGFRRAYPTISVEIDVDDASVDLASRGFDAGIRIGDFIERDLVAVRLTPDFHWRVLGAPPYLAERGRPLAPKDLMHHECIGYRFPTAGSVYRWQFARRGREITVDAPGGLVVNDHLSMIALARAGAGLAYTADLIAAKEIAEGSLEPVLDAFSLRSPGLFLHFPSKSQHQPKLRAFIDFARRSATDARTAPVTGRPRRATRRRP